MSSGNPPVTGAAPGDRCMATDRKPADGAVRPRRSGRSAFQEEQIRQTRQRILDAATQVFNAKPYFGATIADIVKVARISRVTFYLHFPSKLAVAADLVRQTKPRARAHFATLADLPRGDVAALARWVEGLRAIYVEAGFLSVLAVQIRLLEPEGQGVIDAMGEDLLDGLGAHFPAFAALDATDRAAMRRRVRARNLLQRLDAFCIEAVLRPGAPVDPVALEIMAEDMAAMLWPNPAMADI